MAKNDLSFEEALKRLDTVLNALNDGDIPLEEALQQYREGMEMARLCEEKLKHVEGELKILQDGMEISFDVQEGGDA